jgi:hypothetical protein
MTEFPYGASPKLMGYFAGLRVLDDPKYLLWSKST